MGFGKTQSRVARGGGEGKLGGSPRSEGKLWDLSRDGEARGREGW